jgi:voltage-gated potassium channel
LSRLWRDRRIRSTLGLAAVLVLYFVLPVNHESSAIRLASDILVTLACLAVAGAVVFREFRRVLQGEDPHLTGLQLLIVLEVVMVMFALTYFSLAHHGHHQMVGVSTRLDALYFSATTMTTVGYGDVHAARQLARGIATVQLVFDVIFIAAFARLLTRVAVEPAPRSRPVRRFR